jgi:hypothetical protein
MTNNTFSFRPWRTFLALLLAAALALYLAIEAGQAPFAALALWADSEGAAMGPYLQGLLSRAATNPIAIGMAILTAVILVYAALQALGMLAGSAGSGGAAFLRRLAGRPGPVTDAEAYRTALAAHGQDRLNSPIRLGLTAFPMVGFLGTVIGLSGAIRDLPAAVQDKAKLPPVLDNLYVAFDTTALGLIGAILCLVLVWAFDDAAAS